MPTGFSTTARAPARRAFIEIFRSSASTLAETTTIGVGFSAMIRRVASKPFMPGRRMSIEMTSGDDPVQHAQRLLGAADRRGHLQPRVAADEVLEELPDHPRVLDDHDADLFHDGSLARHWCQGSAIVQRSWWSNFRLTM